MPEGVAGMVSGWRRSPSFRWLAMRIK